MLVEAQKTIISSGITKQHFFCSITKCKQVFQHELQNFECQEILLIAHFKVNLAVNRNN